MHVSERGIARWFGRFWPHPMNVRRRDVLLSCLGGALGLAGTEWVGRHALGVSSPWFIAPMGASTVLLFGVPASPLAQPWSIVGGNLIAALIGVSVAALVPHPGLAAGLAVGLAMAVMFPLRCLHPPSGAVALTAVLGGPAIRQLGFHFVLSPVLLNSVSLACLALIVNNLAGRRYPHPLAVQPPQPPAERPSAAPSLIVPVSITRDDLHVAMSSVELLDIDEDDLEEILHRAETRARERQAAAQRS
jgi:CBS domain-containing membrane protein